MAKLGSCIEVSNRFYSPRKSDRKAPVLSVHNCIGRMEASGWRFVKTRIHNGEKQYVFRDSCGMHIGRNITQLRAECSK